MLWIAATLAIAARKQLSVATWNLLAPCYAAQHKYAFTHPDNLQWDGRKKRIVQTLASIDADAVCLQEVQVDLWPQLEEEFKSIGYDAVLQDTDGHPVGCAILYRAGVLRCLRSESRSRALITVLAPAALGLYSSGDRLYLASVHLEAGGAKSSQRFWQIRKLLRRLELQHAQDNRSSSSDSDYARTSDASKAAVILAGDFNFDRRSHLYELLASGRAREGDDSCETPFKVGSYSHPLLPLIDAYGDTSPPWGPNLRSSYRNGRLLDFVWISKSIKLLRPMPVPNAAGSSQPHRIPSARHPSDHFPVGALLAWQGAPHVRPNAPNWQQPFVESVLQRNDDTQDVRY